MNATYMIPAPSILLLGILIAIFIFTFRAAKNRQDEPEHRGVFRKVVHGLLTFLQAFLTTVFLGGLAAGLGLLLLKSPLKEALIHSHGSIFGRSEPTPFPQSQRDSTQSDLGGAMQSLQIGPQFEGILHQLESVERQLEQQMQSIQVNPQGIPDNLRRSVGELKGRLQADRLRIQTMIKEQSKAVQEEILRQEMKEAQARVTQQAKRLEELEKEVEKSRRVTEHMEERAWDRSTQTLPEEITAPPAAATPAAPELLAIPERTPEAPPAVEELPEGDGENVPSPETETQPEDSVNTNEDSF